MRKLQLLLLACFAGIALHAAGTLICNDSLQMPMERTWWLSAKKISADWSVEKKQYILAEKLRLRFIGNKAIMRKFELINAADGKVVKTITNFKSQWLDIPKKGEYITRFSGIKGKGEVHTAVDSYSRVDKARPAWDVKMMPNWRHPDHTKVSAAPDGGVILTPTGKWDRLGAVIRFLTPGKSYRAEFEVASFEKQQIFARASWKKGKKSDFVDKTMEISPSEGVRTLTLEFTAGNPNVSITIYTVKKLHLRHFRLQQIEKVVTKSRMIGSTKAAFAHRNPYREPANAALKVPTVYKRPPRMVYFDSIPQPHEIVKQVETFSTPGDYAVWYFAVHNPTGSRTVGGITISDLKCGKSVIPAKSVQCSFVEFQDYPSFTHNYMNIPERILPLNMKAEDKLNRMFWLQTKLPENSPAGLYRGTASVMCGNKPISFPIVLRVLPFKLRKPGHDRMHWATYSNLYHGQKRLYSADAHHRYVMDMKDYGIEAMHVNVGGGQESAIKRTQSIRKRAGMNGPLFLAGTIIERHATKACGYTRATKDNPNNLKYTKNGKTGFWFEFPEVREKFVEICKQYRQWVDKYGGKGYDDCYILGHDEAHLHKDLFASAMWQFKLYHKAGFKSIATVYPPERVADLAPVLNISNNMLAGSNARSAAKLAEIVKKHPQLKIVYLGAGSYRGQEGGLMPNRLQAGFLSYKIGCAGSLSYTYLEPSYPVDHFKRGKLYNLVYPVSKKPDGKGRVNYFTLQYEGIREGITDYKYLYTLECGIADARKAGKKAAADAAEKALKKIVDSIPYMNDVSAGNGITQRQTFNNDHAEAIRTQIAAEIIKLQK